MEKEKTEKKKHKEEEIEENGADAGEAHEVKREIVVPGEVIAKGDFLPGEGTLKSGTELISIRFGLLEKIDKLVKVIPLSGAYVPRRGNTVIGQITDISFNGWMVDILAPYTTFLPVIEFCGRIHKDDLAEYLSFGDMIVSKIKAVKGKGVDLSMRDPGMQRLDGGIIIQISPTRVPRVIGRAGSMVSEIKAETDCNIVVGQNGLIWISGKDIEGEILAKEAIEMIARKPFVEGLTEKVKEFLTERKEKLKIKKSKEVKKEKE